MPGSRTKPEFPPYFRLLHNGMLIKPELIERLADTLEGIAVTLANESAPQLRREAGILVYHSGRPQSIGAGPVAGESPLLDITLSETDAACTVLVNSALGMIELHDVDEIRLLESTEEAAFYSHQSSAKVSILTLSSRGVLQVYMNVAESLADSDLNDLADEDLRAAVAMKIFQENAEVFRKAEAAV
jgi:hypothetical protein